MGDTVVVDIQLTLLWLKARRQPTPSGLAARFSAHVIASLFTLTMTTQTLAPLSPPWLPDSRRVICSYINSNMTEKKAKQYHQGELRD
jgi:hypothetical protein